MSVGYIELELCDGLAFQSAWGFSNPNPLLDSTLCKEYFQQVLC